MTFKISNLIEKPFKYVQKRILKRILDKPVVMIVGMHRSGTGLLAEVLQNLDVFMGKQLSVNRESPFFQQINKDLLDIYGCNWKHIGDLPATEAFFHQNKLMTNHIKNNIESKLLRKHFGITFNLFSARIPDIWGWKDPRNSLLISVWKDIFPEIKILNILRDGRDVALSLTRRDIKRYKCKNRGNIDWIKETYSFYLVLWEEYVGRIMSSLESYKDKYCLTYENLLRNPIEEITNIAKFIDRADEKNIKNACSLVNTDKLRNNRYEEYPFLREIETSNDFLFKIGY